MPDPMPPGARPFFAARLARGAGLAGVACGLLVAVAPARPDDVDIHFYLIGDAGAPAARGEPVLTALRRELSRDAQNSFAVFLGDNVYERGLPDASSPDRSEGERRLDAQVDVITRSGARGLFIPGNHDWDRHGRGGWEAIRRQARYVEERGHGNISFLPNDGCPGPRVMDVGARLRLLVLDTQWWLHTGPKPRDPTSNCPEDSEEEVAASLKATLAAPTDRVQAVLAHHPLDSGGGHGGHFGWKEHVFPLRAWHSWLWLPLPGIGSAYPLARKGGVFAQDMPAAPNRLMRAKIEAALAEHPPLVWASGHEHGLQVLRGESARYLLVSGAGIYGHTKAPMRIASTLFASGEAGFMRLDIGRAGEARLAVLTVDRSGKAIERFSADLK